MNVALAKEFQNRIVNANQADLVVINYEMLIAEVDESIHKYENGDESGFQHSIRYATKILRELIDGLDMQYEISMNLMSLYIYINGQLIESTQKMTTEPLESAKQVLKTLLIGWEESAKAMADSNEKPMVKNSQQVYAGLTYGKGTLNETVYQDSDRGFKA